MLEVHKATLDEVLAFAPHLRAGDREELYALDPTRETAEMLVDSFRLSPEAYIAAVDGRTVAFFGLRELETVNVPWMLASDYVTRCALSLVRLGRRYVREWAARGKPLMNYVHAGNAPAISWLRAIGFVVTNDQIETESGAKFLRFERW